LLVDVHEESVGFPVSHLLDGGGTDSIEKHSHGSPHTEGVAADIAGIISKLGVETNCTGCSLQGGVDLVGSDVAPCFMAWLFKAIDRDGLATPIGHDVVDLACQGLDCTVLGLCALLMNALALHSILLVRHLNGGFKGHVETQKRGCVCNLPAMSVTERDVFDRERYRVGFVVAWLGVLPNTEEIVDGCV
jgi:hypothetical protein